MLKILKNELKMLKISVLITTVALILFTASLFSILSVYFNLSDNIFSSLDNDGTQLEFDAYESNFNSIIKYEQDGIFIAYKNQLTMNTSIKNKNGDIFETEQKIQNENGLCLMSYSGMACYPTATLIKSIDHYKKYLNFRGEFVSKHYQICLSDFVSKQLNVSIGDIVYINDITYKLTGIYSNNVLGSQLPYYFVVTDDNFVWDRIKIQLISSKKTYSLYNKLNAKGINVELPTFYDMYINNFSLMNASLISSSIVIFIVIIVIIYALFSMILLNRKSFICRLDILGYKRENVFAIYYGIITLISFIVNLIAIFIAKFVGKNIIALCTDVFSMQMVISFPWWIALCNFFAVQAVSLILYFVNIKNIRKNAVKEIARSD